MPITQFMAENAPGLRDEDGNYSDWLELYNPAATPDPRLVVAARNENEEAPAFSLHLARVYWKAGDPAGASRTWQQSWTRSCLDAAQPRAALSILG